MMAPTCRCMDVSFLRHRVCWCRDSTSRCRWPRQVVPLQRLQRCCRNTTNRNSKRNMASKKNKRGLVLVFEMLAFPLYTSYKCDIREGYRRTFHWEPSKDHDDCNSTTAYASVYVYEDA